MLYYTVLQYNYSSCSKLNYLTGSNPSKQRRDGESERYENNFFYENSDQSDYCQECTVYGKIF